MSGEGPEEVGNAISGGSFHGPVLQGRDFINSTFVTTQAAAAPVAPAQLPPLAAGFTGREAELAQVAGLLDPAGGTGPVVVSAVAGLAGVGKTALAVHAAHAARSLGWFPGGVLFIDLHGYGDSPVQPGQALDALLRALWVPGEHIPEGAEQRAGLYRSALAQIADPVLVIADNASAEAQVRLLIPGPGPHRVIITSRHTLAGLGARLLDVEVMDQTVAVRLMDEVVRAGRPDDDRIGGDPAAAGRLAGACGGLPLALQITATLLVADLALTAAELAAEMTNEVRRLETLRYDDGSGVSAPSVAAAFELSYRKLDEDAARLFRLLPADPGSDVSTGAAAELTGWPTDQVRAALGRLTQAHLVEPAGAPGRWRMHDLLRVYARQVPSAGEREQAVDRVLAYYLRQAQAADKHLRAVTGTQVPTEFTDRDDAVTWLDAERPNLVAAVTMAAATGRSQEAMVLPVTLSVYLQWRRRFDDWLAVLQVSRDSARQLDRKDSEATVLTHLGGALGEVRRFEEAISAHQDAVAIYQEIGDRHREAWALNNLSVALRQVRRFEEAISAGRAAVACCREFGDRHGEGMALNTLGLALRSVGQIEEAIGAYQDAAAIFRETGGRRGEGNALSNLSWALREAQRFDEAISAGRDAATIYRESGDRHGEGLALNSLGTAQAEVGRFEEAMTSYRHSLAIFQDIDDRHSEGMTLTNLGAAQAKVGRFEEAITAYQNAAAIFRETKDRHDEGQTLGELGDAYQQMEQLGRATECWRAAAEAMRDAGDYEEAVRLEQQAQTPNLSSALSGSALAAQRET